MAFVKAVKEQVKLRLAVDGLAGTGKTYSCLAIAHTLATLIRESKQGDGRIAVIDSERGSARLYADKFDFDVCELDNFSPLAYVETIKEAEGAGYDIIIADSISHAWAGKNGALEQKDNAAERGGNSWTAWRSVTPKHNALVDAMLQCRAHFMATMRQKMEYVQDTVNGKTEIKRVGLAAVQREGMEYEFTLVGDIDHSHTMKIAKTRCDGVIDIGDQFERPGEVFARRVWGWMMSGAKPGPSLSDLQRAFSDMPRPEFDAVLAQLDAIDAAATPGALSALAPELAKLKGDVQAEARRRYLVRLDYLERTAGAL